MNRVSVVIPVFNYIAGLERAVLSVVNQTEKPAQVIVVNDGSTPAISHEIDGICSKYSLTLIHHDENKGVSHARNTGILASENKWIAFLDADDYWEERFLECTLKVAHDHSADLVGTAYRYLRSGGVVTESVVFANKNCGSRLNDVFRIDDYFCSSSLGDLPFTCSSVLVARESIVDCGLFDCDLSMGEDQVVWNRLVQSGARSFFLSSFLSNYDLSVDESVCNSVLQVDSWQFIKKIYFESVANTSPYKQVFFDKNSLKAYVYSVIHERFDVAQEIYKSEIVVSMKARMLMLFISIFPKRYSSLLAEKLYRRLRKR